MKPDIKIGHTSTQISVRRGCIKQSYMYNHTSIPVKHVNYINTMNAYLIVCIANCHCNGIASYWQFCSVLRYGKYLILFIWTSSYVKQVRYIADQTLNSQNTIIVRKSLISTKTGGYGHLQILHMKFIHILSWIANIIVIDPLFIIVCFVNACQVWLFKCQLELAKAKALRL